MRGQGGRTPDRFSYGSDLKWGTVIGGLIGWYAGIALFIPIVLAVAIGFITWRISAGSRKRLVAAFSVQAGQLVWGTIGLMMLGFNQPQLGMLVDIGLWSVGLIWLMAKPGKAPLLCLAVYHVLSLVVVVFNLTHVPLASALSKGLVANAFLRAEALIFMFAVYRQMRKGERDKQGYAIEE